MSAVKISEEDHHLLVFDTRTGQSYRLPIDRNTIRGSDLACIQAPAEKCHTSESMYNHTGLRLYDPGFEHVAVMESNITFTDGRCNPPALEYRGYTFAELGKTCDFEDMTYLMIWGQKPTPEQKLELRRKLGEACLDVPEEVVQVIKALPRSTPYYPMLLAGLSAYVAAHPHAIPAVVGHNLYQGQMERADEAIIQTIAAYAIVLGVSYCHRNNLEFQPANPDAPFLANIFRFLHLGEDPAVIAFIDHMWVQGCDHEMNNSAAALLHAASTLADPISCVMSALSSSYGLLHFGAADHVYRMIERVRRPENVAAFLAGAKASRQRVAGIGHRVYKGRSDPRIAPMKKLLNGLKARGLEDPLVHVAYEIERQVNEDPYFIERRLQANIDLYWPFGYTALGIASDAVLPMFLASRMIGLMAHWREAMSQKMKMWRPQQLFVGQRAQSRAAAETAQDTAHTITSTATVTAVDLTSEKASATSIVTSQVTGETTAESEKVGYDFTGIKAISTAPAALPLSSSSSQSSVSSEYPRTGSTSWASGSASESVTSLELEVTPEPATKQQEQQQSSAEDQTVPKEVTTVLDTHV